MHHDVERQLAILATLTPAPEPVRLPIAPRITDKLIEMVVLTDAALSEFDTEEANAILYIEPRLRRIYDDINAIMLRLAQ